jgi:hypothetical protein
MEPLTALQLTRTFIWAHEEGAAARMKKKVANNIREFILSSRI